MPEVNESAKIDITQIMKLLPHRYPFLLVDRIVAMEPDKSIVGIKNVTINEPFFIGHFPGQPIMPGVLLIEAMAQVGAVNILSKPENQGKVVYLVGVDNARFRRPVAPGDQLLIEVQIISMRSYIGKASGKIQVNGNIVAEAELTFAVQR